MALHQIPELRREHLEMVPEFRGEPELLPKFIRICEKLVTRFYNPNADDFQNEQLMHSILSKIKGQAEIDISSSAPSSWAELKNALLISYLDKRDLWTLNTEIVQAVQKPHESPFEFHNKIQRLLNLQISFLQTNVANDNPDGNNALTRFFQMAAVRAFISGCKEPVRAFLKYRKPESLGDALNMLTNDYQYEHTQKINATPRIEHRPPVRPIPMTVRSNHFPQRPNTQRPFQPNFLNNNHNINNRPSTSHQPFRPPGFRPNIPRQTPMSIVHSTQKPNQFRQQHQFQNPGNRPYQGPQIEEIFNMNTESPEQVEIPQFDPDHAEYDFDEEFHGTEQHATEQQEMENFTSLAETIHTS